MFLYIALPQLLLYTSHTMQQLFNNRYVQLAGLTLGLAALFFAIIWLVATTLGLKDFPVEVELLLAVLGAGIIVYKFFASKVF